MKHFCQALKQILKQEYPDYKVSVRQVRLKDYKYQVTVHHKEDGEWKLLDGDKLDTFKTHGQHIAHHLWTALREVL